MNSELFITSYKQYDNIDIVDLLSTLSNESDRNEEDSEFIHKVASYIAFLRDEIDELNCELDNQ